MSIIRSWTRRTTVLAAIAALVVPTIGTVGAASAATAESADASTCSVTALQAVHQTGFRVTAAQAVTSGQFTPPGSAALTGLPGFCAVSGVQRDSARNPMQIAVWLPLSTWNHNFQGVGGGGYSCGLSWPALANALQAGYAAASTDCGDPNPADALTGAFALRPNGSYNTALIDDFARTGIHDMSVDGQAVTSAFYAHNARQTYFNGCSGGGREALMEAQRYPADYNGILAAAPAINWTRFIPAELWPQLVMAQHHDLLPACKTAAFNQAVVRACDAKDGVTDGVIDDPDNCHWNPRRLIGTVTPCGTITSTDATVVSAIWDGPRDTAGRKMWFGLEPGASFVGLANTTTSANGMTTANPWPVSASWLTTWLQHNPSLSASTLTYSRFLQLFQQSVAQFSPLLATDDPNLSRFRDLGGKLIMWHGLADQLIFPQGSVNYYQRVEATMGGRSRTARFARLFLAPGAPHCAPIPPFSPTTSAGAAPTDPLHALKAWVEQGKAPATLRADTIDPQTGVTTRSRLLCPFPAQARYDGHGSTDRASNFVCRATATSR